MATISKNDLINLGYFTTGFGTEVKGTPNPYILTRGGTNYSLGVIQTDFRWHPEMAIPYVDTAIAWANERWGFSSQFASPQSLATFRSELLSTLTINAPGSTLPPRLNETASQLLTGFGESLAGQTYVHIRDINRLDLNATKVIESGYLTNSYVSNLSQRDFNTLSAMLMKYTNQVGEYSLPGLSSYFTSSGIGQDILNGRNVVDGFLNYVSNKPNLADFGKHGVFQVRYAGELYTDLSTNQVFSGILNRASTNLMLLDSSLNYVALNSPDNFLINNLMRGAYSGSDTSVSKGISFSILSGNNGVISTTRPSFEYLQPELSKNESIYLSTNSQANKLTFRSSDGSRWFTVDLSVPKPQFQEYVGGKGWIKVDALGNHKFVLNDVIGNIVSETNFGELGVPQEDGTFVKYNNGSNVYLASNSDDLSSLGISIGYKEKIIQDSNRNLIVKYSYDSITGKLVTVDVAKNGIVISESMTTINIARGVTDVTLTGDGNKINLSEGSNVTINGDGNRLDVREGASFTTTGSASVTYGGKTQQIIGTNIINYTANGGLVLTDSTGTKFYDANRDGQWDKSINSAGLVRVLDGNLAAALNAGITLKPYQFYIGGEYNTVKIAAEKLGLDEWQIRAANPGLSDAQLVGKAIQQPTVQNGLLNLGNTGMFTSYNMVTGQLIANTNNVNVNSLINLDKQYSVLFQQNVLDGSFYKSYTDFSSRYLATANGTSIGINFGNISPGINFNNPQIGLGIRFPIGAFYESITPANDTAASIANRTPVLLGTSNTGITDAQLQTLDTNADGKLSGTELNGLNLWADLNENGQIDAGELSSPASANLSTIKSSDYSFYTRGNAQPLAGVAATPVVNLTPPVINAPASNYRSLRDSNNHRVIATGPGGTWLILNGSKLFIPNSTTVETQWYDWTANQIKQSNDNISLIGTDGNDSFDAYYYSSVSWLPNGGLINFLAGGGNDQMGGSGRADNLWGGTGNDILLGYAGDDKLYGEEGNDHLQGDDGNDRLSGGIDNDELLGGLGNDTLVGGDGIDELQGNEGNDQLSGDAGNDKLFGQVGDDILWGGEGDDILVGFTASNESKQSLSANETDNDTLMGGAGNDLLLGGLGNDILDGGANKDELQGGDGNDQLTSGTEDDRLFGGSGDDNLWGGDGDDILVGFTASNDAKQTLNAGETDNDKLYGGAGKDLLLGGLGNDQLYGEGGDDELQGGDGNDQLSGGAGADRLFGQVGDDILYGGDDDDILVGFTASNESKQTLGANETDNDKLYGGAGHDIIFAGIGDDYIDGGAGADDMFGGTGNDTYIVNSVNDAIYENSDAGYDTVISNTNYQLNQNIEELRLLEGYNIHGTGNKLNNKITGNSADNIIDGITGADTMIGGLGNDTYYVDNDRDQIIELAGEGTDTVQASISTTLTTNLENLNLLDFSKPEKGRVTGTDNVAVDALVFGYPKRFELDYLQGDEVQGFEGTCALTSVANLLTQSGRPTTEGEVVQRAIDNQWAVTDPSLPSWQRGGSNANDQQKLLTSFGIRSALLENYNETGIANLVRSGRGVIVAVDAGVIWDSTQYQTGQVNHAVTLTGAVYKESDGTLLGFYVTDSGRAKVSDMTRFIGVDLFRQAANVLGAYALYTIEPLKLWDENINGTGNTGANEIVGNRGDNILYGLAGNDTLQGGAGNDRLDGGADNDVMSGGLGDDVYIVDSASDIVTELSNEGSDTVISSISYNLNDTDGANPNGGNVENITLAGTNLINATGNDFANTLIGNSANNTLDGGAGNDILTGGVGSDVYLFGTNTGNDFIDDQGNAADSSDTVRIIGVASNSVTASRNGMNLVLNYGSNSITVNNHFAGAASAIEKIEFDGNIAWNSNILGQMVNTAPIVLTGIIDTKAHANRQFRLTINATSFSDADDVIGDTLALSATLSDNSPLPVWLAFNAQTRTFSGVPGVNDIGTLNVKVSATDQFGMKVSDTFDLVIDNATNNVPTVANAIGNQAAIKDKAFSFVLPSNTFADVDSDDILSLSATLANGNPLPNWLTFNAATRTFSGTPHSTDVGGLSLKVTATDLAGATISSNLNISVLNSNVAPTLTTAIANKMATEDAVFNFVVPTNTFADTDAGDILRLSATLENGNALPSWLSFNAATRTFSGTPLNDDVGSFSLKVTATDMAGATISSSFNVIVTNTNDAPTVANDIGNKAATDNLAFSFIVPVNTFDDADVGDVLSISATLANGNPLPTWLTFNAATRTFSGSAPYSAVGNQAVRVIATDIAGSSTYNDFNFTIMEQSPTVVGTNGSDLNLQGTSGADVLDGLAGNDYIYGRAGNDIYQFRRGSGHDTVEDNDSTAGNLDRIRLASDILPTDVTVTRNLFDLEIKINGTQDRITLSKWFLDGNNFRVEQLEFANGTLWTATDLLSKITSATEFADYVVGTNGNDTISALGGRDVVYGQEGNDVIDGGKGNDYLYGGPGDDVFLFGRGSGRDVIAYNSDSSSDILRFTSDINPSDVKVSRGQYGDLILKINGTQDQVTIASGNVRRVEFANEIVWNIAALIAALSLATEDNDYLGGTAEANTINGLGGNDTISSRDGNDTLDGGSGDDKLDGGIGNDTYYFGNGYGQDNISDFDWSVNADKIVIKSGVLPANVQVSRSEYDLYLSLNGGADKLTITNWFSGDYFEIETIEFADPAAFGATWNVSTIKSKLPGAGSGNDVLEAVSTGSSLSGLGGDDTLLGGIGVDTLDGGIGNDTLKGSSGNDTYMFDRGYGQDAVTWSGSDRILLGSNITPLDVTLGRDGFDLLLSINGTSDVLRMVGWFDFYGSDTSASKAQKIQFVKLHLNLTHQMHRILTHP